MEIKNGNANVSSSNSLFKLTVLCLVVLLLGLGLFGLFLSSSAGHVVIIENNQAGILRDVTIQAWKKSKKIESIPRWSKVTVDFDYNEEAPLLFGCTDSLGNKIKATADPYRGAGRTEKAVQFTVQGDGQIQYSTLLVDR